MEPTKSLYAAIIKKDAFAVAQLLGNHQFSDAEITLVLKSAINCEDLHIVGILLEHVRVISANIMETAKRTCNPQIIRFLLCHPKYVKEAGLCLTVADASRELTKRNILKSDDPTLVEYFFDARYVKCDDIIKFAKAECVTHLLAQNKFPVDKIECAMRMKRFDIFEIYLAHGHYHQHTLVDAVLNTKQGGDDFVGPLLKTPTVWVKNAISIAITHDRAYALKMAAHHIRYDAAYDEILADKKAKLACWVTALQMGLPAPDDIYARVVSSNHPIFSITAFLEVLSNYRLYKPTRDAFFACINKIDIQAQHVVFSVLVKHADVFYRDVARDLISKDKTDILTIIHDMKPKWLGSEELLEAVFRNKVSQVLLFTSWGIKLTKEHESCLKPTHREPYTIIHPETLKALYLRRDEQREGAGSGF